MKRASSKFGRRIVKLGGGGAFDFTTGELSGGFSSVGTGTGTPDFNLGAGAVKMDPGQMTSVDLSAGANLMNPGATPITLDNPTGSVATDQLAAGTKSAVTSGAAAGVAGMALDTLGNALGNNGPKMIDPKKANQRSAGALSDYNKTVAKTQRNKKVAGDVLDTVGTASLMIPGVGAAGFLAAKGVKAIVNALPFGKKKAEDAKQKFEFQQQIGEQEKTTYTANVLKNSMPKRKAFEFGSSAIASKGMKLGMSKRSFYESKDAGKQNNVKKSKSKFAKK